MGYKKEVIKGISYIGSLRFITKIIGFLETIILARILAPAQFGVYGIALLSLGLLEVLTETGINVVLIQEEDIKKYIDSAWIVSIFRGVLISVILFLVAPFISKFFRSPNAKDLLLLISIVPLLRGFINPSVVKFQKELMFGRDFSYRSFILLIDTATSIIVTYITRQPTGIIVGLLSGVVVELILSYFIVTPKPTLHFKKQYVLRIFHRGKWVTASGIFAYLFENIDNIVVGRMLGAAPLGVYQIAYSLAVLPLNEVGKVFVHVTTPVMVKMLSQPKRLRNTFLKSLLSVCIIAMPIVFLFSIFPYIFVWVLGEKWKSIVFVLPILACLGLVRSLSGVSSSLFISLKKQNIQTQTMFVTSGILFLLIVPLVKNYGIVGAALSALIGALCAVPFIMYSTWRIFKNEKI